MKKRGYVIILLLLIFSCEPEDAPEAQTFDFENILSFSASISTPDKERDFTYHNHGYSGVFENPESQTSFKSEVKIEYMDSTASIPPSKINIRWFSNIDGVIHEGSLNDQYESLFEKSLSRGNHKIYFEASLGNNSEFIAKDSINVSNAISLQLENTDRSVKLQWSKYNGNDFESYLIYRQDFKPLVEISDIDVAQYEDTSITLAETKEFQVIVKTSNDEDVISGSNIEEEEAGRYTKIPHYITKTIYDETRDKMYALVGEKRSLNYATEYGLMILDNNPAKVEINTHILEEYRFSDLDMSPDGKYLFLSQRYVDKITRIDLTSLEVTRFDIASYDWGVHKIEVGDNYMLYCHRTPPTSGDSPLFILDGISGEQRGYYNWLNHGDIEYNAKNNKLYHSTSVTSEKQLIKFGIDQNHVVRENIFAPDIPFPKPFLLISQNGEQIFWENFQLDKDLNVIREHENPIIASSFNSSYLSDGQKLMNFNDLSIIFEYPNFPSHYSSSEIFTNDDSLLFIKSSQPYVNERYTHFFKMKIDRE